MRIGTWNVKHTAKAKLLSSEKIDAIGSLDLDVVVLTECATGPFAEALRRKLRDIGYLSLACSPYFEGQNQVVIASRSELRTGFLAPTEPYPFPANVLHVSNQTPELDILGVRLPSGKGWTSAVRRSAWDWILKSARQLTERPAAILGDFNTGLASTLKNGGAQFNEMGKLGWSNALPPGTLTCRHQSSVDHIFLNRYVKTEDSSCIWELQGRTLGAKKGGLSDHAVLIADVTVLPHPTNGS